MRTIKLAACLSALALASTLSAQSHDPAPTRVRTQTFEAASGTPEINELGIKLDCSYYDWATIQVNGGTADNLALWLVGTQPAALSMFGATILVRPDISVSVARFDAQGITAMAVPLEMKALIGYKAYVQAIGIGTGHIGETPGFVSSQSMSLEWFAGNAQPPTTYDGPPVTAVLVHELGKDGEIPEYELYAHVAPPTNGYRLYAERVFHDPGRTSVYFRLYEPDKGPLPPKAKLPDISCLIPLGPEPEKEIAVYVSRVDPNGQWLLFELVALIDRDF